MSFLVRHRAPVEQQAAVKRLELLLKEWVDKNSELAALDD